MPYKVERKATPRKELDDQILKHCLSKMDGLVLAGLDQRPGIICSKQRGSFDLTILLILVTLNHQGI